MHTVATAHRLRLVLAHNTFQLIMWQDWHLLEGTEEYHKETFSVVVTVDLTESYRVVYGSNHFSPYSFVRLIGSSLSQRRHIHLQE
jgi:hypothetical protein